MQLRRPADARYICFDLDGTLTDPEVGITRCLVHALETTGGVVPSLIELKRHVGRPLHLIFKDALRTGEAARIEEAIKAYRDRFSRIGLFENEVYPGIAPLLASLNARGKICAIVTLKARVYSEQILEHFDLSRFFSGVFGPELEERLADKKALLRRAVDFFEHTGGIVMVGDRREDIAAAKSLGAYAIGVSYGFGSRAELEEAGADIICDSVTELAATMLC